MQPITIEPQTFESAVATLQHLDTQEKFRDPVFTYYFNVNFFESKAGAQYRKLAGFYCQYFHSLKITEEMRDLAQEAFNSLAVGDNENVENWAKRLGNDISK